MNGNPTVSQKDWHDWLRDTGCAVTGSSHPTIQHIKGSRMRLKGVKGFAGEWYCYGLCFALHLGSEPDSLAISPKTFASNYGSEKSIWEVQIEIYETQYGKKPMSEEEYQIIKDRA